MQLLGGAGSHKENVHVLRPSSTQCCTLSVNLSDAWHR